MVGWYHQFNGQEFEQAPEVGEGQEGLACYSPWGHKESDTTERLNNCAKHLTFIFPRVSSSYKVAKVLELQLQHQSFQ